MFTPFHVKSDYSLGYGSASVDEIAGRAAAIAESCRLDLNARRAELPDIDLPAGENALLRLRGVLDDAVAERRVAGEGVE